MALGGVVPCSGEDWSKLFLVLVGYILSLILGFSLDFFHYMGQFLRWWSS